MSRGDTRTGASQARRAILAVAVAGTVAALGALATGKLTFAVGVAVSAGLAFGVMSVASHSGRGALDAGEPVRAGAVAALLLSLRLVGITLLMVAAVAAPAVLDLWGVVAGTVAADAALLLSEGTDALTIA